jgi:hypothetical protein
MLFIIKSLLVLLLLAVFAVPLVIVVTGIEPEPLIEPGKSLSHQDVERIKQLLKQHDPRRLKQDEVRTLALSERDLNLLLDYSVAHTLDINSRVELYPDSAAVSMTYPLPEKYSGNYLNASANLSQENDILRIDSLELGRISLPGWLLNPVLQLFHANMLKHSDEYRELMQTIGELRLSEDQVVLVYQWQPELAAQLKSSGYGLLFSEEDKDRVLAYYNEMNRLAKAFPDRRISLEKVLPSLFTLASVRSDEEGDPKAENRALLQTLAMYVMGINVGRFVETQVEPRQHRMYLTILGRHDLAQHFTVSAALTVSAGSGLASAIGLFKELDDSRDGTGFSFDDLLADRAGVRLAEFATETEQYAWALQQRMSGRLSESDFMPAIDKLPPSIMELEFKQRYRDLDSEKYGLVDDELERRIQRCRVYQPPGRGTAGRY